MVMKNSYTERIKVLLLDDDATRLSQAISEQPDMSLVTHDNSMELQKTIEADLPDIAILGSPINEIDIFQLSRMITKQYTNIRVIILNTDTNEDLLLEAIMSAAVAYLQKEVGVNELMSIIRQVYRGEFPINEILLKRPRLAKKIVNIFEELAAMGRCMERAVAPLNTIEKQILHCLTNGITGERIARTLRNREHVINSHGSAIIRKLIQYDRARRIIASFEEVESLSSPVAAPVHN